MGHFQQIGDHDFRILERQVVGIGKLFHFADVFDAVREHRSKTERVEIDYLGLQTGRFQQLCGAGLAQDR